MSENIKPEVIAEPLGARASRLQVLKKCGQDARVPGKAGSFAITSPDNDLQEERPPIFRTWRRLYLAVLGNLILLIVIFHVLTKVFNLER